jgi:hypothetical protein
MPACTRPLPATPVSPPASSVASLGVQCRSSNAQLNGRSCRRLAQAVVGTCDSTAAGLLFGGLQGSAGAAAGRKVGRRTVTRRAVWAEPAHADESHAVTVGRHCRAAGALCGAAVRGSPPITCELRILLMAAK